MIEHKTPYKISWADKFVLNFVNWNLPNPSKYFALYIAVALLNQSLLWLDLTLPLWKFDFEAFSNALWVLLGIGIIHSLDRVAMSSSSNFQDASALPPNEYENLQFQIVNMPSKPVLVLTLITPILATLFVFYEPSTFEITSRSSVAFASFFIRFSLSFLFFPIVVYHSVRQLSLVNTFHKSVGSIDLFDRKPLNAFSKLTSGTGVAWIVLISLNLIVSSLSGQGALVPAGPFWLLVALIEIVLAVTAFILPLVGIRNKMAEAKGNLQHENALRIRDALASADAAAQSKKLGSIGKLQTLIQTLLAEKKIIDAINVWPWTSATLRGFASAILIPVALIFIQIFIEQLF